MATGDHPHTSVPDEADGYQSNEPEVVVVEMISSVTSNGLSEPVSQQQDCAVSGALSADDVNGIDSAANQEDQPDRSSHDLQPGLQQEIQPKLQLSTEISAEATQSNGESASNHYMAKQESPTGDKDVHGNLTDAVHYFEAIEKRLIYLEDKFEKQKDKPDESNGSSKDQKRRVTVPSIKRVNWHHFKNVSMKSQPHAIEVLMGPAKYYPTAAAEKRKARKEKQLGMIPPDWDAGVLEGKPDPSINRSVPERMRVWSIPVLLILDELNNYPPHSVPTHVETYLRPFKNLLRCRDGINAYLETLEAKWGAVEQISESPPSTDNDKPQDARNPIPVMNASSPASDGYVVDPPRTESSSIDTRETPEEAEGLPSIDKSEVKVESKQSESVYEIMDSVEALRDLRCLKKFIDEDVLQVVDRYKKDVDRKIRFHDLWYLFQPGVEVVALAKQQMEPPKATLKTRNTLRAYQTTYKVYSTVGGRHNLCEKDSNASDSEDEDFFDRESAEGRSGKTGPNPFIVRCYYIDYDGTSYFPATHDFHITPFEGERNITSLDIFPARFLSDLNSFRQNLIVRGRRFVGLLDAKHMRYNGPKHVCRPCGCAYEYSNGKLVLGQPHNVTGEVIVDFREAWKVDDFWMPEQRMYRLRQNLREINEEWGIEFPEEPADDIYPRPAYEFVVNDHSDDAELTKKAIENSKFLREYNQHRADVNVLQILAEDELMLLPSRVMGYVLRERIFAPLDLRYLSNVSADPEGFNDLELPGGHKEMVQALVREHFQGKSSESGQEDYDIIAGKGRGLIILLHGVPGVGKTSTAECVAAFTGRPLFPITCGDLGTTATSVEDSLRDKFHLASTWNCVLLLDEADIFLAQRDRQNLERNAIVSVFLRVLEYYDGILFLTTNRVGAFDEAFKSRIHVSLYYPELEEEQTLRIWRKNLARIRKIDAVRAKQVNRPVIQIKEDKIIKYAEKHFAEHKALGRWNGRQIRNAFQTAAALAVYHADDKTKIPILGTSHFKTVAKATRDFEGYLNETMGSNENKRAFSREERAYNFTPEASTKGQRPTLNYETSSQTPQGLSRQQYIPQQYPQQQQYTQQQYTQQQYSQQPYNPQQFSQPHFGSPSYQQPQAHLQQGVPMPVTPQKTPLYFQQPGMPDQSPSLQPFQKNGTPAPTAGADPNDSSGDED